MPSPPTSTLLPALPSSVSSKFEPVRFSILNRRSPSASPPIPVPSHQAHRDARAPRPHSSPCRPSPPPSIDGRHQPRPARMLLPPLPISTLSSALPVALIAPVPVSVRFSMLANGMYRVGKAEADRRLNRVCAIPARLVDHVADIVDHIGVVAQCRQTSGRHQHRRSACRNRHLRSERWPRYCR